MTNLSQETIKEALRTSLTELGLTENEISLYGLSLTLGPTPIAKLAEYLNISRPNVYKVISGLERHGLANFSSKNGYKKTFMVESPNVITELLRNKREKLGNMGHKIIELMPDMLAIYRQGELPTSVKILEDKDSYEKVFDSILDESWDDIQFCGSAHDFIAFISWQHENEWIKRRLEKNLKIKCLVFPGPVADVLKKNDAKELRETRTFSGVSPFSSAFQLFGNKVIIWQPKAPIAVVISDEYIVAMLRSVFEKLWETAKT
ncbi:MAG: hypothetical protein NUV78_01410 [Candidatus Zambryskibacteria bacterium]|nr:hypothetical protein [Candidatus Zambryskibacteria bacterium]